ncbi:DEAD/DEAH box helicase [Deltaproteobacteria bacterium PRO3]|nr:DEAD/DEAH box helicase [Deltaproteobacteria bacterium PRO3]
MPIRDLQQLSQQMETLLRDGTRRNLHAQAHARAILKQLGTPEREWPAFSPVLDERLMYFANASMVMALDLVDAPMYQDLATELLTQGAEAIEFLCVVGRFKACIPDELLKAATAYHIAGHHARSYVLMHTLTTSNDFKPDSFIQAIIALVARDLTRAREITLAIFNQPQFVDANVAEALAGGATTDDNAIADLGRRSLTEAISWFLEFLKVGSMPFRDTATKQCRAVAALGREARHVDLWWWGKVLERFFRELGDSSFWSCIGDIGPRFPSGAPIQRYIESLLLKHPATISLWPSQQSAIAMIKRADAPSFCVRMPTSAGKTRIAELCIVRAILDSLNSPNAKCVYIAPFRSLAAEIERTLTSGLQPLGVRVSEVYGGFDMTANDERLIQDTQVLIATPEKLDAVLRIAPELLSDIRLVIFDEGHLAGDTSSRGLRAEFLINRLLWRLGRQQCRHVFLSAVLPNPEDFARWIGGGADHLVSSTWRPSRLLVGQCLWNGTRVRLDYTHSSDTPLDHETFVPQFVGRREVRGIQGVGGRRRPFPANWQEAYASAAIHLTSIGTTLAFVPQARHVESTAKTILDALQLSHALARSEGATLHFPSPDPVSALMQDCLTAIRDELGPDSVISSFIRAGIAIHHGNLPSRVRLAIERLVRDRQLALIVATTTLGQGVNLPIRTVLVRGVQQDQHHQIDRLGFWNIAGRAGRALHENEGHVLFFFDETAPTHQLRSRRAAIRELIQRTSVEAVIGVLHRALSFLRKLWHSTTPNIPFETLCLRIAEDDFTWAPEDKRQSLASLFGLVDQNLLAMAVEAVYTPEQPDRLQEVLRESLLFCQLETRPIDGITAPAAINIMSARLRSIYRRFPQEDRRAKFYKMGFDLDDCLTVEKNRNQIMDILRNVADWDSGTEDTRLDTLLSLAALALPLNTMREATDLDPLVLLPAIKGWLRGQSCIEIIAAGQADDISSDPGELSRIIERVCVYGLAWVMNGIITFSRPEFENHGIPFPEAASHFPAMFKLGVPSPLASAFAGYLQLDRSLAIEAAAKCPYSITEIDRAIAWLHATDAASLQEQGMSEAAATRVVRLRRTGIDPLAQLNTEATDTRRVIVNGNRLDDETAAGDAVLWLPRASAGPEWLDLARPDGKLLGTYRFQQQPVPEWLSRTSKVVSRLTDISPHSKGAVVTVESRRLGT